MTECQDMRCTRDSRTGRCVGMHCPYCDEPCSPMGHPQCARSAPAVHRNSTAGTWASLVAQIDAGVPVTHEPLGETGYARRPIDSTDIIGRTA